MEVSTKGCSECAATESYRFVTGRCYSCYQRFKYAELNPEVRAKRRLAKSEYYSKNREKIKESSRAHRLKNLERYRERKREYALTPAGRYVILKGCAKAKALPVDISLDDFVEITSKPCHYCGVTLSGYGYHIDRRDNSLGYSKENSLPCCADCNYARGDYYTVDEFEEIIKVLKKRRNRTCPWIEE